MKNFKTYLFVVFASFAMTSCLVDDDTMSDDYGKSPNLVGFTSATASTSLAADGDPHNFTLPVSVTGPNMLEVNEAVVVEISVDPSSTAIEGTHYSLDQTSLTLSPDENLINKLNFTILTAGLEPPLAESPYVILNVTSATGGNGTIVNGRTGQVKLTINYLCDSDLAGEYDVVINGSTTKTDVIVAKGNGNYRTQQVGLWTQDDLGGTPGFDFSDVCGEITIPQQNLVELYSNLVEGILDSSSVDPDTGVITFVYNVCASGSCTDYKAVYTPKN